MAQKSDIDRAYEQGRDDAIVALRQFTGVQYSQVGWLRPDAVPEYVAYINYRDDLAQIVGNYRERVRIIDERAFELDRELSEATAQMEAGKLERKDERADRGFLVRATGAASDLVWAPEMNQISDIKKRIRNDEAEAKEKRTYLPGLEAELDAVTAWIDELFNAVDRYRAS